MFWINLILLILLGLLGVMSWIKARNPQAAQALAPLTGVEPIIGTVGMVWGLVMLVSWVLNLGKMSVLGMVIGLACCAVLLGLGLLMALPLLRQFSSPAASAKLSALAVTVAPHKMVLGAIGLGLAVYLLLARL